MHELRNNAAPGKGVPAYGALSKGLNSRQITMISIGGVIGAGFFVGSASAITAAGPAVLVSFAIAAVLVILVMEMLGELATANPDTGSFSTYAQQAMGRWAGFSIGWLYWWFYVLVIPLEAIVASDILGAWLGIPSMLVGTVLIVLLTGTNILSVKNFGALEYWFSLFKVVTILGFIAIGCAAVFGWLPGSPARGVEHLWVDGGFAPTGIGGIASALVLALFSFNGMEIVTIAAAESEDPRKNIRKAIRSVVWRMVIFYFGSIFLIVSLVAWNSPALANGSFQSALETMNISGAATIVQTVILVGVASTLNSAIFTVSRMGYSLATRRDAPRAWGQTTTNGVPRVAILYSSAASLLLLVANYELPQSVLVPLIATIGTIALVMYLVIAVSQVILRKRAEVRLAEQDYVEHRDEASFAQHAVALGLFNSGAEQAVASLSDSPGRMRLVAAKQQIGEYSDLLSQGVNASNINNTQNLTGLIGDTQNLRLLAWRYVSAPDESLKKQFSDGAARLKKSTLRLQSASGELPEGIATLFQQNIQALADYAKAFDDVVDATEAMQARQALMDDRANDVSAVIDQAMRDLKSEQASESSVLRVQLTLGIVAAFIVGV